MKARILLTMGICISLLTFTGCDQTAKIDNQPTSPIAQEENQAASEGDAESIGEDEIETDITDDEELAQSESEEAGEPSGDGEESLYPKANELLANQVNEAGEVMVIMYHNLSDTNGEYSRTVESFKSDLQRLYDLGFTSVSMADYMAGTFDTPIGKTPVVLTFDDGHRSNFRYLEDGMIDPDCTVAILDAFYEEHPDFGCHAIFYLNAGNPFGQPDSIDKKLAYLLENGYEVGNHTYDHEDLSTLNGDQIQKVIGNNVAHFKAINAGVQMDSLALPFGKRPEDEALRALIREGQYEDTSYLNRAILLVGWRPTKPIYHIDLNPTAINRVQSGDGEFQLGWWLDNYEAKPSLRFYSDGVKDVVTVPVTTYEKLDLDKIDVPVKVYDENGTIIEGNLAQ